MGEVRRIVETRTLVSTMLAEGMSRSAVAAALGIANARFGFSRQTWHAAVTRGAVVPRAHPMPLERLLVADTYRSRHNIKNRLLAEGVKRNVCETCGLSEWLGRPLSMALHHVNGDGRDNRLENLRLLCPNCHSQTENFSGRKRSRVEAA